jgi:hypothetical protein
MTSKFGTTNEEGKGAVPKKSIGNDLVPELQSKFEVCVHKMHQLRRSRMKTKILEGKKRKPPS